MPQELSDHSSDTVMDASDLADLEVYSELTTEVSSSRAQYGGGIRHSNESERARSKHEALGTTRPTRG